MNNADLAIMTAPLLFLIEHDLADQLLMQVKSVWTLAKWRVWSLNSNLIGRPGLLLPDCCAKRPFGGACLTVDCRGFVDYNTELRRSETVQALMSGVRNVW